MIYLARPLGHITRLRPERIALVTSLANGFDFNSINGADRHWLRHRGLVNKTGIITDKGHAWARELLAQEADRLMAGEFCQDFER